MTWRPLKAGQVDNLVIHVLPLLLGERILSFDHLGQEFELRREEVTTTNQETGLHSSVTRPE